jgi:hypothetical protein
MFLKCNFQTKKRFLTLKTSFVMNQLDPFQHLNYQIEFHLKFKRQKVKYEKNSKNIIKNFFFSFK